MDCFTFTLDSVLINAMLTIGWLGNDLYTTYEVGVASYVLHVFVKSFHINLSNRKRTIVLQA